MTDRELERAVCAVVCRSDGLRAREIAAELNVEREAVNHILYSSPLMKELCWQDRDYRWHGLIRQARRIWAWRSFPAGTAARGTL